MSNFPIKKITEDVAEPQDIYLQIHHGFLWRFGKTYLDVGWHPPCVVGDVNLNEFEGITKMYKLQGHCELLWTNWFLLIICTSWGWPRGIFLMESLDCGGSPHICDFLQESLSISVRYIQSIKQIAYIYIIYIYIYHIYIKKIHT